jgi:DNA-directed RNA polymerase specialized sigma24 family protein
MSKLGPAAFPPERDVASSVVETLTYLGPSAASETAPDRGGEDMASNGSGGNDALALLTECAGAGHAELLAKARRWLGRQGIRETRFGADDAVQAAFMAIVSRIRTGSIPARSTHGEIETMLALALWSVIADKRRYQARRKRSGSAAAAATIGDPDELVDPRAVAPEDQLAIGELVERLNRERPLYGQVALDKWRGCSQAEIADSLGVSVSTIERAIRKIHTILTKGAEITGERRAERTG